MPSDISNFRQACRAVANECKNLYACSYAQAGLDYDMQGHEAYVQALYILNNITHWRGPTATRVREVLKAIKDVKG